ncbi:Macrophage erythroblast attacher isoform 1 [Mycena venus]|uniref:Macrophage erythroblast attacher isoform 1 n=1 Tax=Mycena venus TaxID=2733690 RepID=A0A8H6XVE8_9AGAR|nr:Macrophage erythroblast attacher isoform 1 [Mycena venus]
MTQPMAKSESPTDSLQQLIVIPALPSDTNPPDPAPNPSSTSTITFDSTTGAARTVKPKPRTNAARRASHNAVERLRRENLNARFLDLASLLPNLANIRRPTKSSIVNSCIAHVHASRRHRFLASQQLRALRDECESLRREANEWRERAGIMPLPTPNRGEVFEMVLAGAEFELEEGDPPSGEGEEEDYGSEEGGHGARYTHEDLARLEMYHQQQHQQQGQFHYEHAHPHAHHAQFQSPFAHNVAPPQSAHSAGVPDHSWHDEHSWYDDHPLAPHSAHEPVMRHPYMHRLQTHLSPHQQQLASQEQQLSPLFPSSEYPYDPLAHHQLPHGQQILLQDEAPKWEFVPHGPHPHPGPGQRLHRQSTR